MTEEILQAAVLRLKSQALERYAIIKDLYHRPTTPETVDQITQHAIALAQLEGAMVTLQQYSPNLASQTVAEAESNLPEQPEEQAKKPLMRWQIMLPCLVNYLNLAMPVRKSLTKKIKTWYNLGVSLSNKRW